MTMWPSTCSGFPEQRHEPQSVVGSHKSEPSAGRRALYTFVVTMIIGVGIAAALAPIGLGFVPGFAAGVIYMLAAALVINSRAARRSDDEVSQ